MYRIASIIARIRRFEAADDAQSILELAIALPFFLLLLTGCVDFGRYMYDGILIGNAARAGVQYGSQNALTAADIVGMQQAAAADVGHLVVTVSPSSCQCGNGGASTCPASYLCPVNYVGTFVQVQVKNTNPFTPLVNIPGLTNALTITRTAIAQVSP